MGCGYEVSCCGPSGSVITNNVDIYLATTGNDNNTGLTSLSPKLTLAGAYAVATTIASEQTPLGIVVIHVASGTYAWAPPPFALTILGDGAGQVGDDGFTTIATGVSAAGTNATNLTLAAPVAVNAYRGFTLEWRSGTANGHRKTIRNNTATVVTPVEVAGYPDAVIDPGVGSNFAILRPGVIFTTTATQEMLCNAVNSSRNGLPFAIVNARITQPVGTNAVLASASKVLLFGVEMNGIFYIFDSDVDAGFTYLDGTLNTWAQRVGLASSTQLVRWTGWAISWPAGGTAQRSLALNVDSLFRGMIVAGSLVPSDFEVGQDRTATGKLEINGGSILGSVNLYGATWLQGNFNIPFTCQTFLASLASEVQISNMLCDGGGTAIPFTTEWGAIVNVLGDLIAQNSSGQGMNIGKNSHLFIRSFSTFSTTGSGSGPGMRITENSEVIVSNVASATIAGGDKALEVYENSSFTCVAAGALNITGNNNNQPAIDVFGHSKVLIGISTTAVVQGRTAGARVRQNSKLTVEAAACSLVATVAGSGVECSGGSDCYFPGAGTVITGIGGAGFGVNARGGGRAFFLGAPGATVTGPAGDLTVGVLGGETVASAALAAALSGVRDLYASAIARTT